MIHPENISAELKESRRWVRGARCDVKQPDGTVRKSCKPPFNSRTGDLASHSNPETWSSYEETLAAHLANATLKLNGSIETMHDERYIGIVCGAPWVFGDIDHCVMDGVIEPWVAQWLEELNTYTEISPSGNGLRFILHGEPPYASGHRKDGVEIYSTKRWVTLTGNVLPGREEIRRADKGEIAAIYARVKAGRTTEKPSGSYTAAKIADLMTKTDFPDLSQAVMSLLTLLAIEHHCDRERVEAEFTKSALYTSTHWKDKWTRLGEESLDKAIQFAKENLEKRRATTPEKTSLVMPDASWTRRKPERWIWDPILLEAGMLNLSGTSSQGKSPLTIDLMARMSKLPGHKDCGMWPDGQAMTRYPLHTILLNSEDDLESRILPYFDEAGGCSLFFHPITGVQVAKEDKLQQRMLALKEDIDLICAEARKLAPHLGAIVIDPVTNYLGKLKMNQEEDVREALMPLVQLQQELRFNVITVSHLNKGESLDPMSRVMGARAFVGVARTAWQCNSDPDNKSPYAHIMSPVRGKLGHGSFRYHTEAVKVEIDGEPSEVIKIVWDGMSEATASQALNPETQHHKSAVEEAGKELRNFLKAGKRSAQECTTYLKSLGYDLDKLHAKRVREKAGAAYETKGRESMWFLPTAQQEMIVPAARRDDGPPQF